MIKLGDYVEDSLTGFRGHAVAKTERFCGPTQFCVETMDSGRPYESWFYEDRLVAVEKKKRELGFNASDSD